LPELRRKSLIHTRPTPRVPVHSTRPKSSAPSASSATPHRIREHAPPALSHSHAKASIRRRPKLAQP